jgi:hypothetical protein
VVLVLVLVLVIMSSSSSSALPTHPLVFKQVCQLLSLAGDDDRLLQNISVQPNMIFLGP